MINEEPPINVIFILDTIVSRLKQLITDHVTTIEHREELNNPNTSHLYLATFLILLENLGLLFIFPYITSYKLIIIL